MPFCNNPKHETPCPLPCKACEDEGCQNEETPNIWVSETFVNKDLNSRFGDAEPYESFTDEKGELFRELRKEYGRCTGKVYIDQKNGPPKTVGWVFLGRDKYSDSNDTYLREVWVTLHSGPPTRTIKHHYL